LVAPESTIVFVHRLEPAGIFAINPDGSDRQRLTHDSADNGWHWEEHRLHEGSWLLWGHLGGRHEGRRLEHP
jgi:hypothetical protein